MPNEHRGRTIIIAVIVVLILALIGAGGWYYWSHRSSNTAPLSKGAKAAQAACNTLYTDPVICHFAARQFDLSKTTYTAIITSDSPSFDSTIVLKHQSNGDTSLTTTAAGSTSSEITLNGELYVRQGNNSWSAYPAPKPGLTEASSSPTGNIQFAFSGAKRSQFKRLGTATCGSLSCVHYSVNDPGSPASTTLTVWIDSSSYQLMRWQSTSGKTSLAMNFDYTPFELAAPSPLASH